MKRALSLTLLLSVLVSVACTGEEYGLTSSSIINGRPSTGDSENWTVYLYNVGHSTENASACSGTVIGPHVVLTAKHCVYAEPADGGVSWDEVPAHDLVVIEANDLTASGGVLSRRFVREWRSTSGAYQNSDLDEGRDIAVLIVDEPFTDIVPRGIGRTIPPRGTPATIVGFGRTNADPSVMSSGVKYVGDTEIGANGSQRIRTDGTSWTCHGDSGGPLLVGDDVVGVSSYVVGTCGPGTVPFYVAVAAHQELIDDALAFVPPCEPSAETCDGRDNNCDGTIDEGCVSTGEPCTSSVECSDGLCEVIGGENLCTRACDPSSGIAMCPFTFHCQETGCGTGLCAAGGEGARADGEECNDETQCFSRRCIDVAGTMRCARQCDPGAGDCGEGLLCEETGECHSCIPEEESSQPRPFGTQCIMDEQCSSMDCTEDEGDLTAFCTSDCGDDSPCPAGFECETTAQGARCLVEGLPLGEACADSSECRSGLCLGTCTRLCDDSPCPSGFECEARGTSSGCFRTPEPMMVPLSEGGGGGCTVTPNGQAVPWSAGLLLGLAIALWRRRRNVTSESIR